MPEILLKVALNTINLKIKKWFFNQGIELDSFNRNLGTFVCRSRLVYYTLVIPMYIMTISKDKDKYSPEQDTII